MALRQRLVKHTQKLTLLLVVSGGLNIILIMFFAYFLVRDHPVNLGYMDDIPVVEEEVLPLKESTSIAETANSLRKMPFKDLIANLDDKQMIESGYSKRDLALACLVSYHFFDLQKILFNQPLQQRHLVIKDAEVPYAGEITVFPGLTDKQYATIIDYARQEKWPLTSQGLFLNLKHKQELGQYDPSLAAAFYLSPEFLAVETLFSRSDIDLTRRVLLEMILKGDWQVLQDFALQQRHHLDLSSTQRQQFLLDYIVRGSKSAAYILLNVDSNFAMKKLDDNKVILILDLLTQPTPESRNFALEMLTSPRSDEVWEAAAKRLYSYAGEEMEQPYDHVDALTKFVPETMLNKKVAMAEEIIRDDQLTDNTKSKNHVLTHLVRKGDTLWDISRKYRITVDELKKANKLDSDFLKPGITLAIP